MPEPVVTLPQRGATQSRYFFTQSDNDDGFKVIAFDSVQTTERDASWEVRQGDMKMRISRGRFELRAARAITLLGEGGGNIHLGQAGCRLEIDAGGNLNLAGKTLNISFQTINLKGQNIGSN